MKAAICHFGCDDKYFLSHRMILHREPHSKYLEDGSKTCRTGYTDAQG